MPDESAHWTTDHDQIRRWVESRGGRPATVPVTTGDVPRGTLRIDFPGQGGDEQLEPIAWDQFFECFEEQQLAFTYEERMGGGLPRRPPKLIRR